VAGTTFLIKVVTLASIAPLWMYAASNARAQAEAPAFELQWSAPAACLSASAARGAIQALIRDQTAGERARARVLIEGSEQQGYVAQIEIARGASAGERELRGAGCAVVAEAAVLIIAMAIDPEGASARAAALRQTAPGANAINETQASDTAKAAPNPTSTTSTAPREAKPEDKRERPPPAQVEEPEPRNEEELEEQELEEEEAPSDPRQAGRFVLGLHGTGDAGSLPRATVGGGVLAGMHWQQLRLELHALAYVSQVEDRLPAPGSTGVSLYTGVLRGCLDLLGAREEPRALGGCAAIEAGLSRGAPRSISDGQASSGFWLASFLGVDARQRLAGPLHARLLLEVGLPVLRPSYEIAPFGRVFHASAVLGRFGISAFVLFP
jgi:hypothetical protein